MAIKLDLSKAYDRISWEFLQFMLHQFWFPARFIHLTMRCVSFSSITILHNGTVSPPFFPSWGPRQGDSLSHLLFVICCSGLSVLLAKSKSLGLWKGIHFGNQYTRLTHMTFVNDIFLFEEASSSNAHHIKQILDMLNTGADQRINVIKSIILGLEYAHSHIWEVFSGFHIISIPDDDFSYLGFSFLKSLQCYMKLMPSVLKLQNWIESWTCAHFLKQEGGDD